MGLVLLTLVLAVLVGWALGGRLSQLERLPYRSLPLLAGAFAALLAGTGLAAAGLPPRPTQGLGLAVAAGLTLAFCLRSRAVAGLGLVSLGLLVNAVVILANGGMPVSADAAARAGLDPAAAVDGGRHIPAGPDTALRPLGDVIPVPLPLRPEVVSVGDLLGAAGMGQLVVTGMLAGRGGWPGRAPATGWAGSPLAYRRRSTAAAPPAGRTAPTGTPPEPPATPAPSPAAGAPAPAAGARAPAQPATVPAPPATAVARPVLVAERRGSVVVWRAATRADIGAQAADPAGPAAAAGPPAASATRAGSPNGTGGDAGLVLPRTDTDNEPAPRSGPT